MRVTFLGIALLTLVAMSPSPAAPPEAFDAPGASNPFIAGYFADPSIVEHDGRYYLYATVDPWGADTLACWESRDFKQWEYRLLNWPTKTACTSPTSGGAQVWAPSVVRGTDGRFYMYVSVGSEVWAGVADHPLGPWRNHLGDNRPLIPHDYRPGYHMIDAEAFVDDDGAAYLYWGSGWNWVNGRCFVVRLDADMKTFASEPIDVTPANYFEAPFMVKHGGTYYLMYSNGKTTEDTYEVRYATSDNPLGPFTEASNSPILRTDLTRRVISPGHHCVFRTHGMDYIVYHRRAMPDDSDWGRQLCVQRMDYTADGLVAGLVASHDGAAELQQVIRSGDAGPHNLARDAAVRASSGEGAYAGTRAVDDNFATRWAPVKGHAGPHWIELELAEATEGRRVVIYPEFATRTYRLVVECSLDGSTWRTLADHREAGVTGSPIVADAGGPLRHVRVRFADGVPTDHASLWEVRVE